MKKKVSKMIKRGFYDKMMFYEKYKNYFYVKNVKR